jgi:hypothetical protein
MQAVAAAPRSGIDESNRKIIASEKPLQRSGGSRSPLRISVRIPGRECGGNRGGRFERLLVKRPWLPTLRTKAL